MIKNCQNFLLLFSFNNNNNNNNNNTAAGNSIDNIKKNRTTIKPRKQNWGNKSTLWIFQATNRRNLAQEELDMAKKGKLRETESHLIPAQNKAIRTNHIIAKIDYSQNNRKRRLFSDRVETINHIISECSKLAQN